MKFVGWYSAITVSLTILLGIYGSLITKQTPLISFTALIVLYLPPAIYIWSTLLRKK
jgi:hypothetical protein